MIRALNAAASVSESGRSCPASALVVGVKTGSGSCSAWWSPAGSRRPFTVPGDTFRIGNTNSRLVFGLKPAEFIERWCAEGPTHHVALGVGYVAAEVRRVASLLALPYAEVH